MTQSTPTKEISIWRRALAYWWYMWGLSVCYSANRAVDRGLYAAGVRSFVRATQVWPDFAGAYYQAGRIRGRELGEYDQARADLSNAIRLAPEWAEPYLQRGMLQRFHGETEAALSDLRQFVSIAPEGYWKSEALHQIEALVAEGEGDKETRS